MRKKDKQMKTIREQEKSKFKRFLERRRDRIEEQDAMEGLYRYTKAKGRCTFPFSYGD
jgi:hypothetical protein